MLQGTKQSLSPVSSTTTFNYFRVVLMLHLYSVTYLAYFFTGKSGQLIQAIKHSGSKAQIIDSFCIASYDWGHRSSYLIQMFANTEI